MTAEPENAWRDPVRVAAARRGVAAARAELHRSTLEQVGGYVGDDRPVQWRASCLCGKSYTGSFELAEKWATRHPEEGQ